MITETAREILESHYWEGNVRELKAVIERIFLEHDDEMLRGAYVEEALEEKKGRFHNLVQLELPEDSFTMQEMEKLIAQKVLRFKDNNLSQTARYLGISRNRLKRLLS
jgi:transcriptional regulator with PAS, ATPase and Fis domain